MTLGKRILSLSACAVTAFCPVLVAAVRGQACTVQKPTAASYTWNFKQEANQDFRHILADARAATRLADRLAVINQDGTNEFYINSDLLYQLSDPVNDIGADVCRLEAIQRMVAPQQQKAIGRIVSSVTLMADNTEDAIDFMNSNPSYLSSPTYEQYLKNVYNEGGHLSQALTQVVKHPSGPYYDIRW